MISLIYSARDLFCLGQATCPIVLVRECGLTSMSCAANLVYSRSCSDAGSGPVRAGRTDEAGREVVRPKFDCRCSSCTASEWNPMATTCVSFVNLGAIPNELAHRMEMQPSPREYTKVSRVGESHHAEGFLFASSFSTIAVGDTRYHTPWADFRSSFSPHQGVFSYKPSNAFRKAASNIFPTTPCSGPPLVLMWSSRDLKLGPGDVSPTPR